MDGVRIRVVPVKDLLHLPALTTTEMRILFTYDPTCVCMDDPEFSPPYKDIIAPNL